MLSTSAPSSVDGGKKPSVSATSGPCLQCGVSGARKRCSRCRRVFFCTKACQIAAWPSHKRTCRAPRRGPGAKGHVSSGSSSGAGGGAAVGAGGGTRRSTRTGGFLARAAGASGGLFPDRPDDAPDSDPPRVREARKVLKRLKTAVWDAARGVGGRPGPRDREGPPSSGPNPLFRTMARHASKFREAVYPGVKELPKSSGLPRTFPALMDDAKYEPILLEAVEAATKKAQSILEGVRRRGAAAGEVLRPQQEAELLPQIMQEAFARAVVAAMQGAARKKHAETTKAAANVAPPTAQQAHWAQLPADSLRSFTDRGFAVIPNFLGREWARLLRADLRRMLRVERLARERGSVNDFLRRHDPESAPTPDEAAAGAGAGAGASTDDEAAGASASADGEAVGGAPRAGLAPPLSSWLEPEDCADFPALGELLERLYALPFEFNAKARTALAMPMRNSTLVTCFEPGCGHALRLDNPGGDEDAGIFLSCAYFLDVREVETGRSGDTHVRVRGHSGSESDLGALQDALLVYRARTTENGVDVEPLIAPPSPSTGGKVTLGTDPESGGLFRISFFAHDTAQPSTGASKAAPER